MKGLDMSTVQRQIGSLLLGVAILVVVMVGLAAKSEPVAAQISPEAPPIPHTLVDLSLCMGCHLEGREGATVAPEDHQGAEFESCTECHEQDTEAQSLSPLITHSLIARSDCLRCHVKGLSGAPLLPEDHNEYANGACRQCHLVEGETLAAVAPPAPTPIPIPAAIRHPRASGRNSCADCHATLEAVQAELVSDWERSIHAEQGVSCADCHGGNPGETDADVAKLELAGYIGVPDRANTPGLCATCHSDPVQMRQYNLSTDQFAQYQESVHGKALYENGDVNVATCVDCHGAHNVLAVNDPGAAVYPSNAPALCASCHADRELMAPYGILTNQYELFQDSVHGHALLDNEDLRAPSCATCHGKHGAAPPGMAEVANVCGSCHSATQNYFIKGAHAEAGFVGPKCVTCHGRYDVKEPSETMFEGDEERHCGSCHPSDSEIGEQIVQYRDALTTAANALESAEETVKQVAGLGMIVAREEGTLLEARTSLITARAAQHQVSLEVLTKFTTASLEASQKAQEMAEEKESQNRFRRQAMSIAVIAILLTVIVLYLMKRQLDAEFVE